MKKAINLKRLLKEKGFIRLAGAHNGITARLVEKNGFDAVWASGFEISTSHAVPDANILTMTDFLNASGEMADSVSIPVVSDCDTGFGNSNNVINMVKKFEAAGISAVCIEDKKFPKVNSYIPGRQELAPIAEFVGKIVAAKNAQQSKDFLVFARVEALIAGWGIDEALKRANTYLEAGADGIFVHSKSKTPNEIINFCKAWKRRGLLIICPTSYPSFKEKEMQKYGVNIVIYANHGIRASIKAVNDILGHLRLYGAAGIDQKIAPMSEVFELQGMYRMKKDEEKYLKSEIGNVKAIIPAAGSKIDNSLKGLLEDRPLAMLDINGKTLIQRNIETLNTVGIRDIKVITGYKRENVEVEGAATVANTEYNSKGIMHSIMKGVDDIAERNIIAYSDIIFDQELIRKLLRKYEDFVLVVDGTYKKTHIRNKELELVKTDRSPLDGVRTIDVNRCNRILDIGKDLNENEAHYEFIGLASLSDKGMRFFSKEFKNAKKNRSRTASKKNAVESFSLAEFVHYMIRKGYHISAYEVSGGWMEVHNFSDYKRACSVFPID
ncbi:MAG: hypothetical protein A2Z72_05375 [Omnitrophica bacterium RBG_13_46_9]|nr:MAG: hypothetical protein A2Z72_05375 [Omnitrophica bacterium RBG_13_46_9]